MSAGQLSPLPDLREIGDRLLDGASLTGAWALLAVGWATVDLDRAGAELAERWPGLPRWQSAPSDPLLGAYALVARADTHMEGRDAIALVLLEPSTEGRLAATLARHGEGPTAVWLAQAVADRADSPRPGPAADGPFGPERLLPGSPPSGPHILLVDRPPGTIDR